jgi:hypothetical protein
LPTDKLEQVSGVSIVLKKTVDDDPDPDPDWHQNNADPHLHPTPFMFYLSHHAPDANPASDPAK